MYTHTHATIQQDLCVEGDSQLVVRQMRGEYKVKTDRLKPLHAEAQELARGFDKFEIRCVRVLIAGVIMSLECY